MSQTDTAGPAPAKLAAERARQAINRWSNAGLFRLRNMGDRITMHEVVDRASFTVRLRSEYERRTVARSSKPYRGGPVDDRGPRPDPWELPARRPTDYENRTETQPVPHTEQVETCPSCHGIGQVTCATCHGNGRVNCPLCQGRGYRENLVTRTETGPGGGVQTRTETVRENCTCFGGLVDCGSCAGRGRVECAPCAGSGQVKTFDLLTVEFRVEERCEVLNATEVPAHLLKASSGKVRAAEEGPRVETFAPVRADVDEAARALLHQAQATAADTRLLFQRLRVEEVGVHEVRYWYGGPPLRHLWIFGDEEHVHAPGAPRPWGRLAAVLGGLAAVVVVVVVALFLFARH